MPVVLRRALCLLVTMALPLGASAQTTDGYHALQALPVVVDSTSFTQRFTLRNPDVGPLLVSFQFHPGVGTAQAAATPAGLACPSLEVPSEGQVVVANLRVLCPGLVSGSAFGMLVVTSGGGPRLFSLFSRVSNPAGSGFAVEGFALAEFTSSASVVTGLRRSAATSSAPAYQTNCFVGQIPRLQPGLTPAPVLVRVTAHTAAGPELGHLTVSVPPGTLYRLLDVFAAVGAPAGEVLDGSVSMSLEPGSPLGGDGEPPLVGFCTVQDNTSYGADFRIAKQEINGFGQPGAMASNAQRDPIVFGQIPIPGVVQAANTFLIPAGSTRNAHLLYVRHPDNLSCSLGTPGGLPAASYGLEMRLSHVEQSGWRVVAGGNDAVGFGPIYLGDRGAVFDNPYILEVESNGQNEGASRPYWIRCRSGSGHTRFEQLLGGAAPLF